MKNIAAAFAAFFLLYSFAAMGKAPVEGAATGESLYRTYCQSCHGEAAKGDGPVAMYLVLPAADLTQIAIRRNGIFPEKDIYRIIDGRTEVRVHGTSDMPVWGDAFRREASPEKTTEYIQKLVVYLKTVQEKE